jgi:hypothetical protein
MMLRVAVRFCGVLVILLLPGFSTSVRAQSLTNAIATWVCTPSDCADNYGPATTGAASTEIVGLCYSGVELGPLAANIKIIDPCVHPVILETSADGENIAHVEEVDCESYAYYIGQVIVRAAILDTELNTTIYSGSSLVDCEGGSSPPLPVVESC